MTVKLNTSARGFSYQQSWEDIATSTAENNDIHERAGKFVMKFLQEVRCQQNETVQWIRSSHGVTDITLVCNKYLEETSEEETTPRVLKFILKCILPELAVNTRFCSRVLEKLGMKTPEIFVFNKSRPQIGTLAKVISKSIPVEKGRYHAAFMQAFPGTDFGGAVKTRALFHLNSANWKAFLKSCGRIAVFDLITGNNDRFYRPDLFKAPDQVAPFFNAGNIMLTIPVKGAGDVEMKVFCIDNGSAQVLRPDKKGEYSEDDFDLFVNAFGTFKALEKRPKLAEIIFDGIFDKYIVDLTDDRLSDSVRKLFGDFELGVQSVTEGVNEGYDYLSRIDVPVFLRDLNEYLDREAGDSQEKKFSKITLKLISQCLNLNQGE